eukprot:TRINITY_DN15155_c0_g1_i1.p1 TRINITY_DN15155_c0_g1~~TRINITY_DN15155_c0_g1_i1.p1  ORF type:complete len:530 (+),score=105.16 TRINITY_DN15155_c0_g1_i1:79-1668(+)
MRAVVVVCILLCAGCAYGAVNSNDMWAKYFDALQDLGGVRPASADSSFHVLNQVKPIRTTNPARINQFTYELGDPLLIAGNPSQQPVGLFSKYQTFITGAQAWASSQLKPNDIQSANRKLIELRKSQDGMQAKADKLGEACQTKYAAYLEQQKPKAPRGSSQWCGANLAGYSDTLNSIKALTSQIEGLRAQKDGPYWRSFAGASEALRMLADGKDGSCTPYCMQVDTQPDDAESTENEGYAPTEGEDAAPRSSLDYVPGYTCNLNEVASQLQSDTLSKDSEGNDVSRQVITLSSREKYSSASSSQWSASGGFSLPGWSPVSISGSAGQSKSDTFDENSGFEITIKYGSCKQVGVQPGTWFDGSLVNDLGPKKYQGNELWPAEYRVASQIVICTAPSVEVKFDYDFLKTHADSSFGGASVGFNMGPFNFGGGGQGSNSNYQRDSKGNGATYRQDGGSGIFVVGVWSTALRHSPPAARMQMLGLVPPPSPLAVAFDGFDVVSGDVNVEVSPNRVVIKRSADARFKGEIVVQ